MRRTFTLYFIFLLCIAPINLLSLDTYYYWEWSRHLAASYYDGPPMIAYFIKAATFLFGDTLFALSLIGIIVVALTAFIIHQTARLFLSAKASLIATALWLFSPLVTLSLLKTTTYDAPLTLFWALTLYFTCRFVKSSQPKFLYAVGLSAGCLLLSKYSGIVLLLGFLIYLLTTPYRFLFKSVHFYLALTLMLLVFSPVLWWNAQHDFISFTYQLGVHQVIEQANPLVSIFTSMVTVFIPALNLLLIPPFFFAFESPRRRPRGPTWMPAFSGNSVKLLCVVISLTFLGFFIFFSASSNIRGYWLGPYLITAALLAGALYEEIKPYKLFEGLISVYLVISLGILITNTTQFTLQKRGVFIDYQLLQQFNEKNPNFHTPVVSRGWFDARMFFFLKNKPPVYTLPCGMWRENQYQFWRQKLDKAFYIDIVDNIACIKPYFKTCEQKKTLFYQSYPLYIYYCQEKIAS